MHFCCSRGKDARSKIPNAKYSPKLHQTNLPIKRLSWGSRLAQREMSQPTARMTTGEKHEYLCISVGQDEKTHKVRYASRQAPGLYGLTNQTVPNGKPIGVGRCTLSDSNTQAPRRVMAQLE